jgi:branched-chain amino acid transport system ATP-binding protein
MSPEPRSEPRSEPRPILNVTGLVKRFGGFHALDGLSFHAAPGEILGLVGPNGSGKTTAINVVSGLYAPDGGQVTLDGAPIGGVASHRLVHQGINRTFQVPKPFLSLTVRENVRVALAYGGAASPPAADALLDEYRLRQVADRPAADLNSAQQKMLDLVRALATGPRLLLLDELAAGLNPAELDWIAGKIKALAAGGMAIIVVEHLMGFIEQITDRVIVLNAGKEIFEGKLAAAVREPQVIEVFLGGEHAA